ncbi:hypothetical protein OE88DRAFT_1737169 [Heliocybe sulcata]|uniref:DUF6593 domain-containing protein n=1 Tax=Heliocybe sulcata TaxID=5364 RepID=A0A5C3MV94_9AGAM|nr:hypothetical protein OE88DRAFT_1737169 [Heliocybe sulcata]
MTHYTFKTIGRKSGHTEILPDHGHGDQTTYSVEGRTGWFSDKSPFRISKRLNGHTYQVGEVNIKSDCVTCNRRTIPLHSSRFSSSRKFIALNGEKYVWKMDGVAGAHLLTDDNSKRTVASYTAAHGFFKKKPAELSVYGEGETMIDEVVATVVYMGRKVDRRKKRDEVVSVM